MGEYTSNGTKLGTCDSQYATYQEVKRIVQLEKNQSDAHSLFRSKTRYRFPFFDESYDVKHASLKHIECQIDKREYLRGYTVIVPRDFAERMTMIVGDSFEMKGEECTISILLDGYRDGFRRTIFSCNDSKRTSQFSMITDDLLEFVDYLGKQFADELKELFFNGTKDAFYEKVVEFKHIVTKLAPNVQTHEDMSDYIDRLAEVIKRSPVVEILSDLKAVTKIERVTH